MKTLKGMIFTVILLLTLMMVLTSCNKTKAQNLIDEKINEHYTTDLDFELSLETMSMDDLFQVEFYSNETYDFRHLIKIKNGYIVTGKTALTPFVMKLDEELKLVWYNEIPSENEGTITDLYIDDKGNCYILGHMLHDYEEVLGNFSEIKEDDYVFVSFISKLTPEGYFEWIIGTEEEPEGAFLKLLPLNEKIMIAYSNGPYKLQYVDIQKGKCMNGSNEKYNQNMQDVRMVNDKVVYMESETENLYIIKDMNKFEKTDKEELEQNYELTKEFFIYGGEGYINFMGPEAFIKCEKYLGALTILHSNVTYEEIDLLYGIMDIREREIYGIVFIRGVEDIENKDGVTVIKRQ